MSQKQKSAATKIAEYLGDPTPLRSPIAVDHHGRWHAVTDDVYSAKFLREPLNLELHELVLSP